MKTLLLEEMSWTQIKEAMGLGYKTVIIAAGAIEQHGPHLPEGTDSYIGYAHAEELAKELGHALVAPTIRPGLSEHHMNFPGTVTLRPSTFVAIIEDYISSYIQHGFETIIILPSHGGNYKTIEEFCNTTPQKYPGTKIIYCMDMETMLKVADISAQEDGIPINKAGIHAGEFETSTMLEFYPHLVNMSLAEEGFTGDLKSVISTVLAEGIHGVTKNGILGDPRDATAERGRKCTTRRIKAYAEIVRKKLAE